MSNDFTPVQVTAPIVTTGQNCWQIGNFYVTAQPTEAGLAVAGGLGIKSVICLRDATEPAKPPYPAFDPEEDTTLTGLGMSFANIPFPHGISQDQFNIRAGGGPGRPQSTSATAFDALFQRRSRVGLMGYSSHRELRPRRRRSN